MAKINVEEIAAQIAGHSGEAELYVLLLLARRLKQIGETGQPLSQAEKDKDLKEIKKILSRNGILQRADINRLYEQVTMEAYNGAKINFDYRDLPFIPFKENKPVQTILNGFKQATNDLEVFKTQAFMLRDPKDRTKLIPNSVSDAYNKVVNDAAEQVTNGLGDYQSAIRKTIKDLSDNGMRTVWYEPESGKTYTQRVESAVKRNILDNVRDINQQTQNELGKQYGADGKEITVHEHSAPDHEPIQGHQFSNEEFDKMQSEQPFEDYKGKKYAAIKRGIGKLNCYHFAFSIILGLNKPTYTDEQLEENIKRNHEGYTDENGKERTKYECTQEQRRLERQIRKNKQGQVVAKEAGDIELARTYQAKVNICMEKYINFSEKCDLPLHPENYSVPGYRKIKI